MPKRICSIDGCQRPHKAKDLCIVHYTRLRTHGDPNVTKHIFGDPVRSFWAKVDKSGDCWKWTATLSHGYGSFRIEGKSYNAHRLAYEWSYGPIPEGLVIDHTCRVRACVNPAHLRAVTNKQNIEHQTPRDREANKSTGIRGVYSTQYPHRWRAIVRHNGVAVYLGNFGSIQEAESAVIAKRNELYTHNNLDRLL